MFGKIVLDIPAERFEERLDAAKERKGEGAKDTDLDADDLRALTEEFKAIIRARDRAGLPPGAAHTAREGDRGRVRVVERRARRRLPAPEQDLATTWAPR